LAEDAVGAVFSALADPTRRRLVEKLARGPAATPTSLAAELPMTRQAVTKHLRALGEAGLVSVSRAGRETRYELTPQALGQATSWLAAVGAEWDERLSRLERTLRER
jgi:DNA-binding transcriptional ArsR family regulator